MPLFPVFISVVIVLRNQSLKAEEIISAATSCITNLVSDHEIIIVDNASNDKSLEIYKKITGENGLPNIQVYALTKEVDIDVAAWVGLENGLGDFFVIFDPLEDSIQFIPKMLAEAMNGADVVFATNTAKVHQGIIYRFFSTVFNKFFSFFIGIHLNRDAPNFRLLNKKVVNYILKHPHPELIYRHLPATGGFARINLNFNAPPQANHVKKLSHSIDKGIRLLVSTTRAPMRLVTSISLFGASANLLYSIYVIWVMFFRPDIAPGWISLSLQQSGMFFLISLVLLVLGEYILHMSRLSNEGPLYNIGQEFFSGRMSHREKLNIVESPVEFPQKRNQLITKTRKNI